MNFIIHFYKINDIIVRWLGRFSYPGKYQIIVTDCSSKNFVRNGVEQQNIGDKNYLLRT
jgi:hypothetical protein